MVREGLGGHQMISQKSFQEGMGCGALTLSTLHKRHKVRNQPRLASRACVGGLKSRKGGGHRMLEAHSPSRERQGSDGQEGILAGSSWAQEPACHAHGTVQGLGCKPCPG